MVKRLTIEIINDGWKEREKLEAHYRLKDLRKPDELNQLIMTKVNLLTAAFSRQCDMAEVRDDVATLIELIQIRKSRKDSSAHR